MDPGRIDRAQSQQQDVNEMSLSQARRNQLIIAGISSVLLSMLWAIGDLPRSMYYTMPFVIAALWIPAVCVHKQRDGGLIWTSFFGLLGIVVVSIVVRAVWLIGGE